MRKFLLILFWFMACLLFLAGYIQYKFHSTEAAVIKYLTDDKKIPKKRMKTDSFLSNLPGDKNWMVAVTIKGDPKTYTYYLNEEDKIVLESYSEENGEIKVLNQTMN